MSTPSAAEAKLKSMIERLHSHVDALFEAVLGSLKGGWKGIHHVVDERLVAIEELRHTIAIETLLFIARWQPLGRDLARAEGYIRASYDLFRIARYLREIVKLDEAAGPLSEVGVNLNALAKARDMVSKAVKALLSNDSKLASEVEAADREIDRYYEASVRELSREPIPRKAAIEALFARHVERIADHATYIAKLSIGGYLR